MPTFTRRNIANTVNYEVDRAEEYTGALGLTIDGTDPVVQGAVTEFTISIDVSAVKGFMIVCDRDVIIETNSSGAPDDTINLLANKPYVWTDDDYNPFLLTADVTSIFATLAAGANATLRLEAVVAP